MEWVVTYPMKSCGQVTELPEWIKVATCPGLIRQLECTMKREEEFLMKSILGKILFLLIVPSLLSQHKLSVKDFPLH